MAFFSEGTLTTESREVAVSETWDAWANPQSMNNVEIVDVSIQLAEVSLPQAGLLHNYDWSDDATTTSTVPDLAGSDDLTGTFTDLSETINGVQAGTFDGTDDSVEGTFSTILSQPIEIFTISQSNDNNDIQAVTTGTTNNNITARQFDSDDYQINASGNITGGSLTTNPEILTTRFDGSGSLLRVNGSEVLSGDAGTNGMDGLVVSRSDLALDGAMGQALVYDPTASGYSRSDVETYLANMWGISI